MIDLAANHPDMGTMPATAPEAPEPDDLRTLEEAARFFDVSAPTMRGWIKDGCPVYRQGDRGVGYALSLRAINGWLEERRSTAEAEAEKKARQDQQLALELLGTDSLTGNGPAATARMTPAQQKDALEAELRAIKVARERRELVRADLVALEWAKSNAVIAQRLRGLPDKLAQRFQWGEDETAALLEEIDGVLDELADAACALDRVAA
jgi:phage terminase Nu1 subunit (DNA packaging protein)